MPKFIFTYRPAKSYDAVADPDALAAWGAFLNDVIGPNAVDPGAPVFEASRTIGEGGTSTRLGGYSIIAADDLETAVSMARSCPTVARGGGVEVGVLADVPEQHPADQMRTQRAGT